MDLQRKYDNLASPAALSGIPEFCKPPILSTPMSWVERDNNIGPGMLSTVSARPFDRRLALLVSVISSVLFAAALPFIRLPLVEVPAFIPSYESALALNDLITAVLLFGQFARLRSASLLVLASGYLFNSVIIIPHALTFPGAFSASGLLGAGEQTTAWLYVIWHAAFPLSVLGYALLKNGSTSISPSCGRVHLAIAYAVGAVLITVSLLTLLVTSGMDVLPVLIQHGDYSRLISTGVSPGILCFSALALAALWRQRRPSVLDTWLMVVMSAWIFDVALSAVVSSARYDLGWYAGRSYGLLAASFILVVLLLETNGLHLRLTRAQAQLADRARELEHRVRERTEELQHSNEVLTGEICERERAQQELLRMRAFLDVVIESIPAMLLVMDAQDGKCVLVNRAGEQLLGVDRTEIIGTRMPDPMPGGEPAFLQRHEPAVSSQISSQVYEHPLETRNNGVRLMRTRRVPVLDEQSKAKYVLRFSEDITEQRQTEEQLRQAQKMEALGQLTGGLAHDFNNLLAVVIGNLDLLNEVVTIEPKEVELVRDALEAALSGAELTRSLLAFARRQPLQPGPIDVNELVIGISKLLARTLGENIKIEIDAGPRVSSIVADRAQLETAIANLANNARDAMPSGGRLIISTRHEYLDEDYVAQHVEVQSGNYVCIEVTDTGQGMPPETLKRIFEPFYTTKGLGKGTGLGLSMVFGFVKQSGGHINVYSEVGRGTTFRVYLRPAEADLLSLGLDEAPLQPFQETAKTILVVEDNKKLREVVVKQLKDFGFIVIEVENAPAALAVLDKGGVDLLFTDVVLPGDPDGVGLAREVATRYPGLKILLTSGFPGRHLAEVDASMRLLVKPYRKDDLARSIHAALNDCPAQVS